MEMVWSVVRPVLAFLLVLNVAVIIHEAGHLAMARRAGVRVRAFSIGWGPVLWRRRWGKTEYRLSALPVGGYVDIEGLHPDDGQVGFVQVGLVPQLLILAGGASANIALALALLTLVFWAGGVPDPTQVLGMEVSQILQGSPAAASGLAVGDILLSANGQPLQDPSALRPILLENRDLAFQVRRRGEELSVRASWDPAPRGAEPPRFGIGFRPALARRAVGLPGALGLSLSTTGGLLMSTVSALSGLSRLGSPEQPLAGPVGVAQQVARAAAVGWDELGFLAAALNLGLGVFNLLPIPALDGGRVVFVLLARLRRRRWHPKEDAAWHAVGFVVLILFLVWVSKGDILRVLSGG